MILAIDPGTTESALVWYEAGRPVQWGKWPNAAARLKVPTYPRADYLAIEMVQSFGMAVGASVFETCVWVGRFIEKWGRADWGYVYRRDVKLHLCNSARAKDANVRQALIDRYGGKDKAIGKKATPGPLYGMTKDCWSALAVAITATETKEGA